MAKITLESRVTLGTDNGRIYVEAGEQEVSAEVEKALIDAGLIEAPKKAAAKTTQADK